MKYGKINFLGQNWEYEWEINSNDTELSIYFFSPILLPKSKSTDKKLICSSRDNSLSDDFLKTKIEALLLNKYKSKMNDSFNSLMRLKSFKKLVEELKIDKKFVINADFFKALPFNEDIIDIEIELYVNKYMQHVLIIEGIERKVIERAFSAVHYLTASTKPKTFSKVNTFNEVEVAFNNCKVIYEKRFNELFPKEIFYKLLFGRHCDYCGISTKEIEFLRVNNKIFSKSGRGFTLEIDRLQPNLEYSEKNCCMSCYWCNNAKTDEFSCTEFTQHIAPGIRNIWNYRLGKTGLSPDVANEKCSQVE